MAAVEIKWVSNFVGHNRTFSTTTVSNAATSSLWRFRSVSMHPTEWPNTGKLATLARQLPECRRQWPDSEESR